MEWLDDKTIKVLDKGFVSLIDAMPNQKGEGDIAIVNAARTSYGEGTKSVRDNTNLIRYLLRNDHTSPFEMVEFKFLLKMPIFVARQHIRHRTANVNEYSGRYSVMMDEFYIPECSSIKTQSLLNKQASDKELPFEKAETIIEKIKKHVDASYNFYEEILNENVSREISRIVLPINVYTKMYWKVDLHNLLRYLKLRMDYHAQYEIRVYAEAMYELIKEYVPITAKAFEDYVLNGVKFSKDEKEILLSLIDKNELIEKINLSNLSKTEKEEFIKKVSK